MLKTIKHPNIAEYVNIASSNRSEKLAVVVANPGILLSEYLSQEEVSSEQLQNWMFQLASALSFLQEHNIICQNLSLDTISVSNNNVILINWGFQYLCGYGELINFPVGKLAVRAPESILPPLEPNSDVYSLGIIFGAILTNLIGKLEELTDPIAFATLILQKLDNSNSDLALVIKECLKPDPAERITFFELLGLSIFENMDQIEIYEEWPQFNSNQDQNIVEFIPTNTELLNLTLMDGLIADVFFGPKNITLPSIFTIPTVINVSSKVQDAIQAISVEESYTEKAISIPLLTTLKKIEDLDLTLKDYTSKYKDEWKIYIKWDSENIEKIWEIYQYKPQTLKTTEKESDFEYSLSRLKVFRRLLSKYPHSVEQLREQATFDIPPTSRGIIWAALLNVSGDPNLEYRAYSDLLETETDRQLEMDIPRCHQYHLLLSTPEGHFKLKKILKAWIKAEQGQNVYWQGLDSICACFLSINFNDEVFIID